MATLRQKMAAVQRASKRSAANTATSQRETTRAVPAKTTTSIPKPQQPAATVREVAVNRATGKKTYGPARNLDVRPVSASQFPTGAQKTGAAVNKPNATHRTDAGTGYARSKMRADKLRNADYKTKGHSGKF